MTQSTATFNGTREDWCTQLAHFIFDDILCPETGVDKPPFRVTIGWPKGVRSSATHKVLGSCHPRSHSRDGHNEIFISPVTESSIQVAETIAHENCHAADDCESGHKGAFKQYALAIGLIGKMTETVAGSDLRECLLYWIEENGECPMAPMDDTKRKKQSTRMHKLECGSCGFTARTSKKWVDQLSDGGNTCPCCERPNLYISST